MSYYGEGAYGRGYGGYGGACSYSGGFYNYGCRPVYPCYNPCGYGGGYYGGWY